MIARDSSRRGVPLACLVVVTALVLATFSSQAKAQTSPPFDTAIDVQLFEVALGPGPFLTVPSAVTPSKGRFSVDFIVTFLTDPFSILNVDPNNMSIEGQRTEVVKQMVAGGVSGAYGLSDKLQLGVWLPLVFRIRGDGLDPATAGPAMSGEQVRATGFGDMRVEAKYAFYKKDAMRLSAIGGVTLPTSVGAGGNEFLGDDLPGGRLGIAAQFSGSNNKLQLGAYANAILRKPRDLYNTEVGQQLQYGVAAAFMANPRVSVIAEMFGRTGLTTTDGALAPVEAAGAVRIRATPSFVVVAGGGAGLVRAIGSPALRVFASIGWSPDFRDQDGDGIRNQDDKCPLQAEDKDGFEDGDGCPDLDNDNDKRPDATDKCPLKAEDFDGFEDEDGCPDLDNDRDGIPDLKDRCPDDAEDGKKPRPVDGCPAGKRDSDQDGIFDDVDKCPAEEEDKDGYKDDDGCPDPDNDGDGIPDVKDKCPLCAEDKDGDRDDDGCPDIKLKAEMAGPVVKLSTPIRFDGRDRIRSSSLAVVDAVAALMLAHTEVTKWMIIVAPKGVGRRAARARQKGTQRAAALVQRLTSKGVKSGVLQGVGANAARDKVRILAREHSGIQKRFICPAEFRAP